MKSYTFGGTCTAWNGIGMWGKGMDTGGDTEGSSRRGSFLCVHSFAIESYTVREQVSGVRRQVSHLIGPNSDLRSPIY